MMRMGTQPCMRPADSRRACESFLKAARRNASGTAPTRSDWHTNGLFAATRTLECYHGRRVECSDAPRLVQPDAAGPTGVAACSAELVRRARAAHAIDVFVDIAIAAAGAGVRDGPRTSSSGATAGIPTT